MGCWFEILCNIGAEYCKFSNIGVGIFEILNTMSLCVSYLEGGLFIFKVFRKHREVYFSGGSMFIMFKALSSISKSKKNWKYSYYFVLLISESYWSDNILYMTWRDLINWELESQAECMPGNCSNTELYLQLFSISYFKKGSWKITQAVLESTPYPGRLEFVIYLMWLPQWL